MFFLEIRDQNLGNCVSEDPHHHNSGSVITEIFESRFAPDVVEVCHRMSRNLVDTWVISCRLV